MEDTGIELTSGSPSFEESDPILDSAAADEDVNPRVVELSESKLDGESCPIVGVVVSDEAERSEHGDCDDDDFEFTFAGIDRDSDWLAPGEVFPIFDRRLLSETESVALQNDQMEVVRSALKELFVVDDDRVRVRVRAEDPELDAVAPGSYCVWTPGNSPQASPARCKKSSSTGSTAKRWGVSLRELLIRRSKSDGQGSFVRFGSRKKMERDQTTTAAVAVAKGGGEKRRTTYLPYKKAIVGFGFYPRVNGFGGVNLNRPPF